MFYVRSRSSSDDGGRSIRATVRQIDPALTVLALRTIDDQLDRMLTNERMLATLAGRLRGDRDVAVDDRPVRSAVVFRGAAHQGNRHSPGAGRARWSAGGLIVREAAVLAVLGLAIALPVSWVLGRLIESQLFGVRPMDAATLSGAAAVLLVVCLVASAVPARRAGAVNPLDALRAE